MPEERTTSGIEERIGGLEVGYNRLSDDVAGLGRQFRDFASEIRKSVQDQQQTPWGTLGVWTGVASAIIVSIGGLVSSDIKRDIQAQREDIKDNAAIMRDHETLAAHPAISVKVEALEKAAVALDDKIQKEIHLADDRLQGEIRAEGLRTTTIENIMAGDDAREAMDASIHSALWERVFAIERDLFGKSSPMVGRAKGAGN